MHRHVETASDRRRSGSHTAYSSELIANRRFSFPHDFVPATHSNDYGRAGQQTYRTISPLKITFPKSFGAWKDGLGVCEGLH